MAILHLKVTAKEEQPSTTPEAMDCSNRNLDQFHSGSVLDDALPVSYCLLAVDRKGETHLPDYPSAVRDIVGKTGVSWQQTDADWIALSNPDQSEQRGCISFSLPYRNFPLNAGQFHIFLTIAPGI